MLYGELYNSLKTGGCCEQLTAIYGAAQQSKQTGRFTGILDSFARLFGEDRDIGLYSAPGRTEVGGNHTDHNHGRVLAAAINLDAVAAASKNDTGIIHVKSDGHDMNVVDLSSLEPSPTERGRSSALVRGVCAGFVQRGYAIGGFDATTTSDVLSGSGLSSSAAFEVLLGTILNYLYNDGRVSAVEIAQIAQYAENKFFGKPCGLMDQTACSVGGFVTIDFCSPEQPIIEKLDFDFASCGHSLCIVDTKGSHADLTHEYAAVRAEMESVAAVFGKKVLREVTSEQFKSNIAKVRAATSDRAVLRALHFYADNDRVEKEVAALTAGDFEQFKSCVIDSGNSSYMYNQNVYTCSRPLEQPVSLALAMSADCLVGKGAWRVHGGGFAGTIQAFVPDSLLGQYRDFMQSVFGDDSCKVLRIRADGGVKIL